MTSGELLHRFAPENSDAGTVVISKKKLDQWLVEHEDEKARLREEIEELRRRIHVQENPIVPPRARSHAPGFAPVRPPTSPEDRRRPGGQPSPGTTGEPLPVEEHPALTAERCRRRHWPRLKPKGTEFHEEIGNLGAPEGHRGYAGDLPLP